MAGIDINTPHKAGLWLAQTYRRGLKDECRSRIEIVRSILGDEKTRDAIIFHSVPAGAYPSFAADSLGLKGRVSRRARRLLKAGHKKRRHGSAYRRAFAEILHEMWGSR